MGKNKKGIIMVRKSKTMMNKIITEMHTAPVTKLEFPNGKKVWLVKAGETELWLLYYFMPPWPVM